MTVALNRDQLVILDAMGRVELLSLDWSHIKSLHRNSNKGGMFVIKFLTQPEKSRYMRVLKRRMCL